MPRLSVRRCWGELLSFGRPGALAVVSIDCAEELVAPSRTHDIVSASLQEDQLGLVLGRTVEHEIGHYLLNTRSHARSGLMRASFEVARLVDRRSGPFELDARALAWLQDRISRGMTLGPPASAWTAERGPPAVGHISTGFSHVHSGW